MHSSRVEYSNSSSLVAGRRPQFERRILKQRPLSEHRGGPIQAHMAVLESSGGQVNVDPRVALLLAIGLIAAPTAGALLSNGQSVFYSTTTGSEHLHPSFENTTAFPLITANTATDTLMLPPPHKPPGLASPRMEVLSQTGVCTTTTTSVTEVADWFSQTRDSSLSSDQIDENARQTEFMIYPLDPRLGTDNAFTFDTRKDAVSWLGISETQLQSLLAAMEIEPDRKTAAIIKLKTPQDFDGFFRNLALAMRDAVQAKTDGSPPRTEEVVAFLQQRYMAGDQTGLSCLLLAPSENQQSGSGALQNATPGEQTLLADQTGSNIISMRGHTVNVDGKAIPWPSFATNEGLVQFNDQNARIINYQQDGRGGTHLVIETINELGHPVRVQLACEGDQITWRISTPDSKDTCLKTNNTPSDTKEPASDFGQQLANVFKGDQNAGLLIPIAGGLLATLGFGAFLQHESYKQISIKPSMTVGYDMAFKLVGGLLADLAPNAVFKDPEAAVISIGGLGVMAITMLIMGRGDFFGIAKITSGKGSQHSFQDVRTQKDSALAVGSLGALIGVINAVAHLT